MANATWQRNNATIQHAYYQFYIDHKRAPTHSELAKLTKLSEKTIGKHFGELDIDDHFEDVRKEFAPHVQDVLWGMVLAARRGNAQAAEVFMGYVMQQAKPQSMEIKGGIDAEVTLQGMFKEAEKLKRKHDRAESKAKKATGKG